MQRKAKIAAALLGGISAMPMLHACVTVPETVEVCDDTATPSECPDETLPVEIEE